MDSLGRVFGQKITGYNYEPHYIILRLPGYERVGNLEFETEKEAKKWIRAELINIRTHFLKESQFGYAKVYPMYTEDFKSWTA